MILVEGKLQSWGRADMVIKLLDVDLPASYQSASLAQGEELPYTLEDVVEAARNCRDRQSARVYLTQECSTCLALYPMSKVCWFFSLFSCRSPRGGGGFCVGLCIYESLFLCVCVCIHAPIQN